MTALYVRAGGGNSNAAATYSLSSGGGADGSVPTAADDVYLDAASGNFTLNAAFVARSVNCTGYTGTLTHNASITGTLGDATAGAGDIALKLVSGMTYTKGNATSSAWAFASTSATVQTVETGGKSMGNMTFNGPASNYKAVGAFTAAGTLSVFAGTFDDNGQQMTILGCAAYGSTARTINHAGTLTWSITGATNPWNMTNLAGAASTGLTFTGNPIDFHFTDVTTTSKNFLGGGNVYGGILVAANGASASGTFRLQGSDSFSTLLQVVGGVKTISVFRDIAITIRSTDPEDFGNASNLLTIVQFGGGANGYFSKAGGVVHADYVSLTAIPIVNPDPCYAGSHSVDGGGNTGWTFADAPVALVNGGDGLTATGPNTLISVVNNGYDSFTAVSATA